MRIWSVHLLLLCFATISWADDSTIEMVVSAHRFGTEKRKTGSSITVIDSKEIEERQVNNVQDLLKNVVGVDVVKSGGLGGNSTVFMRGANSEHTLVLIDGVEVNNPITTARSFNFSDLATDNIERIEVLRGPQSTIYGSDALGGVINIITKKGGKETTGSLSFEGGAYNSTTERAAINGGGDKYHFSAGLSRTDTDGISAASSSLGNTEDDGFHRPSFSSRFGFAPSEIAEFDFFLRKQDSTSDLDNTGGIGGDDLNRMLKNKELFSRGELKLSLFDDILIQKWGISWAQHEFDDDNDPDELSSDFQRSEFSGRTLKFDLQNQITITDWLVGIAGLETEEETGDSRLDIVSAFGPFSERFDLQTARTNGYYAELRGELWEVFYPTAGIRVDNHSDTGNEVTWRVAPAIYLADSGTKLSTSVGTGFKAPSLFQLYSSFGDPELEPEESIGVDAGIEQAIEDLDATIGVTFFYNRFDNLITFDPNTFIFSNISEATTRGIETTFDIKLSESLTSTLGYTLNDTEDESTDDELLRRPRHKLSGDLRWQVSERSSMLLNVQYVGEKEDNDFSTFPASRVTLDDYVLVNLAGSYMLRPNLELFARVDNLFDEEYEDVFGFGTMGAAIYGGIKVTMQ